MSKILQKYENFTSKELDEYSSTEGSCVKKINSALHLSMGPYSLANFKHALHAHLVQTKVGLYDINLNGIVLGIKNIKVLGTTAALRTDDPAMHIEICADFYVFSPVAGCVLNGTVKHISHKQISVVIYRVFNAAIRFSNKIGVEEIEMNQEIKFSIKDFDLRNVFPYIEGEILQTNVANGKLAVNKIKKFDVTNNGADSGFEEKDEIIVKNEEEELDELLTLIKQEPVAVAVEEDTEDVANTSKQKKKKDKKNKRKISESEVPEEEISRKKIKKETKIKQEPDDDDDD